MVATRPSSPNPQTRYTIAGAWVAEHGIEIEWGDGHHSHFHHIWLRDNCACEVCVLSSGERQMLAASIPPDVTPSEAGVGLDGGLEIVWVGDGHRTRFDAEWLRTHCYSPSARAERRRQPILWGAERADDLPTFEFAAMMGENAVLLQWCEAVREVGVALLHGAGRRHMQIGWMNFDHLLSRIRVLCR